MKRLKSENVDISFICNKNWSPPRKLRKINETTTVVNGEDIQIMSPAYAFLKNIDSYIGGVQRKSISTEQESKFEA